MESIATYDLGTARGKIEIDTSDLTRASAAFTSVGTGLLGIGAAAAAGVGLAITTAANFEKTISAIGAVLGADPLQLGAIRQQAMQLGKDTVFSAKEVAEGMEELAKAGLTIEQITGGAATGMTNLAAAAGNMGLDRAAVIAVNAMKTFGLNANELDHVANSLAGAANKSTLEVEDLAVSLRYVGGTAKAMGANIDEVNTVLAILGDRGIRGSTAGTSLRGVLLSLTPSSKKAAAMMKELGLITADGSNQFFNAKGEMKDMREVMQILGNATKDLTEEQKVQAFNTIFQRRAMASALFLAEAGAKGFDEYAAAINQVSAADVAAAKLDNLAGDMEKLKSNIETFLIEGGTPFQEELRKWTQGLTNLVQRFGELDPATQRTIFRVLAYGAAAFLAMGSTLLVVGQVIKFVEMMIKLGKAAQFAAAKLNLLVMVQKLKSGFETLQIAALYGADGLRAAAAAAKAFAVSLLTNPVFLIIAAIIALGVAIFILYKKWKPFHELVDRFWQDFQTGWDAVVSWFGGIPKWFEDRWKDITNVFRQGVEWIKQNWDILLTVFTGPIGALVLIWRRFGEDIVKVVSEFPGKVVDLFANMPERVAYWLGFLIGASLRLIIDWITLFNDLISSMIDAVVGFFKALPGRVIEVLNKLWDDAYARTMRFKDDFLVGIELLVNGVIGFFRDLPGNVISYFTQLWDDAYAEFFRGKDRLIESAKETVLGIVLWIATLPARLRVWWDALKHDTALAAAEFVLVMNERIRAGIETIVGFFRDLPSRIITLLESLRAQLLTKAKSIGNSMWEGFKQGLFGSPKTKIEYALLDLLAAAKRINADMGIEMSRLQSMTFSKLGDPAVSLGTALAGGAAMGAGSSISNQYQGDKIDIHGADQKSAQMISKEIMFAKRVRVRSGR